MKNLIFLFLLNLPILATAQGIHFANFSYEEALKIAKKQKKMLFVDFTADWCKPCKMMEAEVLKDSAVGEMMNAFFICIQLNYDSEKYLAGTFGIQGIPHTLCIDSTGMVLARTQGYGRKDATLAQFRSMLRFSEKGKRFLEKEYLFSQKKNLTFIDFKQHLIVRRTLGVRSGSLLAEFWKRLPAEDLQNDTTQQFFADFNMDLQGDIFDFLLKNKAKREIKNRLLATVMFNLEEAVKLGDRQMLKDLTKANALIINDPSVSELENDFLTIQFYRKSGDEKRFHKAVMEYLKDNAKNTTSLWTMKLEKLKSYYTTETMLNEKYRKEFEAKMTP